MDRFEVYEKHIFWYSPKRVELALKNQVVTEASTDTLWNTSTHRLTVPTEVPYWVAR